MKVVFIDIDGVLNHTLALTKTKYKIGGRSYGMGIYLPTLKKLKHIVDKTGAKIVLISSWKSSYEAYLKQYAVYKDHKLCKCVDGYYLREKFRKVGLEIYDTTLNYEPNMWHRGEGILNWINDREKVENIDNYIIIDDELFDYALLGLSSKVVQTSFDRGGLTDELAELAISKLKS